MFALEERAMNRDYALGVIQVRSTADAGTLEEWRSKKASYGRGASLGWRMGASFGGHEKEHSSARAGDRANKCSLFDQRWGWREAGTGLELGRWHRETKRGAGPSMCSQTRSSRGNGVSMRAGETDRSVTLEVAKCGATPVGDSAEGTAASSSCACASVCILLALCRHGQRSTLSLCLAGDAPVLEEPDAGRTHHRLEAGAPPSRGGRTARGGRMRRGPPLRSKLNVSTAKAVARRC
eukprot:6214053-Pleurochrysis_carterae.AAC.2